MVFSYYNRLNAAQKKVYRKSDDIHTVPLANASGLHPFIIELAASLEHEDRANTVYFSRSSPQV